MQRTYVYVDGFNLYNRALKDSPYKWLNIKLLVEQLIQQSNKIIAIKYYTARVAGLRNPSSPRRQQIYLNALKTLPQIEIFFGRFLSKTIRRPLANPIAGLPKFVEVMTMEEKGTDVNLASHMIHDGWKGLYDVAVVISNDSDLAEPVRIVRDELKKSVGVLCPHDGRPVKELVEVATFKRIIRSTHLSRSQFPDVLSAEIEKPMEWYPPGAWSDKTDPGRH